MKFLSGVLSILIFVFSSGSAGALATSPVISHLKTGESSAATREFVAIYNNSPSKLDITGWCIVYSSASDQTKSTLGCLTPPAEDIKLIIQPFGYARFASQEFVVNVTGFVPDKTFSAGISGTSGHIRLLDTYKTEIDKVAWGTAVSPEQTAAAAHASSKILQRKAVAGGNLLQDNNNNQADFAEAVLSVIPASGIVEETIVKDLCDNIDGLQTVVPDDYFATTPGQCIEDVCDNITGLQSVIPLGYGSLDGTNCTLAIVKLESSILQITEMLPNVSSYDTGKEYVEIYNPNNHAIDLGGYKLQLGPAYTKSYTFANQTLQPHTYYSYGDSLTGIVLPNTSANLRLVAPSGDVVSQTDPYDAPKDDEAWALISGVWQYTDQPTEALANLGSLVEASPVEIANLVPCATGKVRNPATNRCKTIEVAASSGCPAGQERNPETNRCRSVSAFSNLVPCIAGQERNPATNRCRSVVSTASSLVPCATGQERNPETNRCRKSTSVLGANTNLATVNDVPAKQKISSNLAVIGVLIGAVLAYAGYEWRHEARRFVRKLTLRKS